MSDEITLDPSVLSLYAPIFILEKDERYYPENPMDFLRASRFRHHRGFASDQGWSKIEEEWITGNSTDKEYYDIPVEVINSFRIWPDGRNRRPRDPNEGDELNVFLQPRGRRVGDHDPNRRVPWFYKHLYRWDAPTVFAIIQYWIFHGYSDGALGFNHQGDWEGIAVGLNRRIQPEFVSFAAHGKYTRVPWRDVMKSGNRPISYIEKGTHANFPNGRRGHAGGYEWDVSHRVEALFDQPWSRFAGAWGEVGKIAGTTGPLGPETKHDY